MIRRIVRAGLVPLLLIAAPVWAQTAQTSDATGLPAGLTAFSPGHDADGISWQFFVDAVKPANGVVGGKPVFESWPTDEETYPSLSEGQNAAAAGEVATKPRFHMSSLARIQETLHPIRLPDQSAAALKDACSPPRDPAASNYPPDGCIAEEVRRNPVAFDFIVQNKLNTLDGLKKNFASGARISFPAGSVEFKADWMPITDIIKWLKNNNATILPENIDKEYYTTTVRNGGLDVKYALVAINMNIKNMPNWQWSTFEHKFNPGRCDTMGCYDDYAPASASPNSTPNTQYGACFKHAFMRAAWEAAKVDRVWQNYCLKETQIAFTADSAGNPAIVDANTVVEVLNAGVPVIKSSCITCHATAAFNKDANFNADLGTDPIGNYQLPATMKAYDFVWGFITINGIQSGH